MVAEYNKVKMKNSHEGRPKKGLDHNVIELIHKLLVESDYEDFEGGEVEY